MLLDQLGEGDLMGKPRYFTAHSANARSKFRGTAGSVTVPERHFAGFARSRRNDYPIMQNFIDSPSASAEDDGVSGAALEDHFLVQFADAAAFRGARQKNAVEAPVRNRAAVNDCYAARALPSRQFVGDPVPGEPRA